MFDEKTKEKLKYYVYLLIDPDTNEPFYVGKGKDDRVFSHINIILKRKSLHIERIYLQGIT